MVTRSPRTSHLFGEIWKQLDSVHLYLGGQQSTKYAVETELDSMTPDRHSDSDTNSHQNYKH